LPTTLDHHRALKPLRNCVFCPDGDRTFTNGAIVALSRRET